MMLITVLPGQHQHGNSGDSPLDSNAIAADQAAVALSCPTVVGMLTALPEGLLGALAVRHSEFMPTLLLSDEWLQSSFQQIAISDQLGGFLPAIRGKVAMQLLEWDPGETQPGAIPEQHGQFK